MKKLKTIELSYFIGKSHFEEDGTQNYLVFQPLNKYLKIITNTKYISLCQSKGLSDKTIKPPTTSDYKCNLKLSYFGTKTKLDFRRCCLKQDKITFNHGKIVNIYTAYELGKIYVKTTPTLVNCLFRAVTLTKNADIDKYKYSGYRIGFDRGNIYSFGNGFGRNVITFGADMNTSIHFDNKGKYILILGKGSTQGLGEHSLTVEKIYSVNPTDHRKKYCLSLQYNGANSYLFVNGTEIIKFKAKDSEIAPTPLCL